MASKCGYDRFQSPELLQIEQMLFKIPNRNKKSVRTSQEGHSHPHCYFSAAAWCSQLVLEKGTWRLSGYLRSSGAGRRTRSLPSTRTVLRPRTPVPTTARPAESWLWPRHTMRHPRSTRPPQKRGGQHRRTPRRQPASSSRPFRSRCMLIQNSRPPSWRRLLRGLATPLARRRQHARSSSWARRGATSQTC